MNLFKLKEKFKPSEIEFRVGAVFGKDKENPQAIALPYITNRAIQNRLDEVCGAENWCNDFREWQGTAQICGISIQVEPGNWITKWDGADKPATEPVKGGLSNSMKRAAVQWGIGRYLYDIPPIYADVVPKQTKSGVTYKFKTLPCLPKEYLPDGVKNGGYMGDVATAAEIRAAEAFRKDSYIDAETQTLLIAVLQDNGHSLDRLLAYYGVPSVEKMTVAQFDDCMELMKNSNPNLKIPSKSKKIIVTAKEQRELDEVNGVLK